MQKPKKHSRKENSIKTPPNIFAIKIKLKNCKTAIVNENIIPIFAANFLGAKSIGLLFNFNELTICFEISFIKLQSNVVKPLIKKSKPKINITP